MKDENRSNLLIGTVAVSAALHIALLTVLFMLPADSGRQDSMTLTLVKSEQNTRQSQAGNAGATEAFQNTTEEGSASNNNAATPPPVTNTEPGADIRDDTLPWKTSSNDAFDDLSSGSRQGPQLDWISSMFGGGSEQVPVISSEAADKALQLLNKHPSTQSDFWPYLVKHLANNKYHDKQYPFSSLTSQKLVILELGFQSNGMLVDADVAMSSGDAELDAAAIRSAYAANPFDPPPPSDRAFGFNYLVQIGYTPKKAPSDEAN